MKLFPPNPFPKLLMRIMRIKYGKNCKFYGCPIIIRTKGSSISIGDNLTVNSSVLSNLVGLYQRTIIVSRAGASIEIGNNVGISGATLYARKGIKIGDNTLIGGNTKILDNDFHPVDSAKRLENPNSDMRCKEIIIGRNVFIGCNSIILKGSQIGDNSVIGAGTVVSGSIPSYSVVTSHSVIIKKSMADTKADH